MRRYILLLTILTQTIVASAKINVSRIDPTDWFVGMNDSRLQLMIYGKDVATVDKVTTDYPGVTVDSIIRPGSANYLLVYLNLESAKAGTMTLYLDKTKVSYTLKDRAMTGDKRQGFTNADVLYMLMPDRFAQGKTTTTPDATLAAYTVDRSQPSLRHGGDIEGIRQHLDYFTDLGVTALWFTPVLENNSPDQGPNSTYHGYATTDYYRVDPRFGTNDEYRQLIDEAHAKGLKVVMDMIFNHCGYDHPWVADTPSDDWFNTPEWLVEAKAAGPDENNAPRVNDKYVQTSYKLTPVVDPYASKIDLKETVDGWFVPTMPDLNQRNHHLMTYLIQNSIWWIETVGIDGIRMDTYPYADRQAMAEWMRRLDNEYPNFNTVGETWVTEPAYTAAWQRDSKIGGDNSYLKTVMDFSFFDKINMAKNEVTDNWWNGYNRIYNGFVYDYLYPNPSSVMAFIENHDTDRFLGNGRDTLALRQALALLLTINRIPQLYYGTEILMNGTKEVTDGNVRRDFPGGFPGDDHNAFTAEGRSLAENAMFNWLQRVLHWRQGNDVIIKGRQVQFIPWHGVYVVARQYEGRTAMTIINGTNETAVLDIDRYAEIIGQTTQATDITTGRTVALDHDVPLRPRQTMILDF